MGHNTKIDVKKRINETDEYIVNRLVEMYEENKNIGPNLERYVGLHGNRQDKRICHFSFGGNAGSGWSGSDIYSLESGRNELIQYEKLGEGIFEEKSHYRPVRLRNE